MKAVITAALLLAAGLAAVAATPTASACEYHPIDDPPRKALACTDPLVDTAQETANDAIDDAQCIATGHDCD